MKREDAADAAILAVFFALRLTLIHFRQTFFDELFTRWISAKPFAEIVAALKYDSGPPLYYFVVHLLGAGRQVSLLASLIAVVLLLWKRHFIAAAFITVFPPCILFAADARAYALCAMFVTIGVLYEKYDAVAFVLAAYSHFYGVLFFPLLVRKPKSLLLALVLFAPGFALAAVQPAGAREWMKAVWPSALFLRPSVVLAIVGGMALLASLRWNKYLVMVLVPLLLAIVLRVYVPMRFESVIATPLALCIAEGLKARKGLWQEALATVLLGATAAWSILGLVDYAYAVPDDYRFAAEWLVRRVPREERVVASGYLYLETVEAGRPDAFAFPVEQAIHPGWRAFATAKDVIPQPPYVWIGELRSTELKLISSHHQVEPLGVNGRAMVARIR